MMTRIEAQARIEAATAKLVANGWRRQDINAMLNGLHREDAVEEIERQAAANLSAADADYFLGEQQVRARS